MREDMVGLTDRLREDCSGRQLVKKKNTVNYIIGIGVKRYDFSVEFYLYLRMSMR